MRVRTHTTNCFRWMRTCPHRPFAVRTTRFAVSLGVFQPLQSRELQHAKSRSVRGDNRRTVANGWRDCFNDHDLAPGTVWIEAIVVTVGADSERRCDRRKRFLRYPRRQRCASTFRLMFGLGAAKCFVFRMAERFEIAIDASRFASDADTAAMPDQLVRELYPLVLLQNFHQILLDLFRFFVLREFQPPCESQHVRIDHHAARDSVGRAQDDVGGFSSDARQAEHLLHRARHFATELFQDGFAGAHHRFGFIAKKSGRADFLLQFSGTRIRKCLCVWIFLVKFFCYQVYADVGALGGKDGRYHQLKRIFVLQFAACVWIGFI